MAFEHVPIDPLLQRKDVSTVPVPQQALLDSKNPVTVRVPTGKVSLCILEKVHFYIFNYIMISDDKYNLHLKTGLRGFSRAQRAKIWILCFKQIGDCYDKNKLMKKEKHKRTQKFIWFTNNVLATSTVNGEIVYYLGEYRSLEG